MISTKNFEEYEAAFLVKEYLLIERKEKNIDQVKEYVSQVLRSKAERDGLEISEKFRSQAGITSQINKLKRIRNGEKIENPPVVLTNMLNMALENPQAFEDKYLESCKELGIVPTSHTTPRLFRITWSDKKRLTEYRDELINQGRIVIDDEVHCCFPTNHSYKFIPAVQILDYMRAGDYFILTYSANVKLFGKIVSDHWVKSEQFENCYELKFETIIVCPDDRVQSYKGASITKAHLKDGRAMWIPTAGGQVFYISQNLYSKFDLGVFQPCFGKSIKEFGYFYQDEPLEPKSEGDNIMNTDTYPLNTILYGPPGTGKTYNTVIYAVAICENDGKKPIKETIDDIKKEAKIDHKSVLKRFDKLKADGRISFTTFHQSYGYEEFIEGIKPVMKGESDAIGYDVVDGIFKEFCNPPTEIVDEASVNTITDEAQVWYLRLGGRWYPELHNKCLERNEIRIGWPGLDYEDATGKARTKIGYFVKDMQIGDIVLIPKHKKGSRSTVGWIAKITGKFEDLNDDNKASKTRSVEWLAKNIEWDVKAVNDNKNLDVLTTIYKLDAINGRKVKDFLKDNEIDSENQAEAPSKTQSTNENKVFIIDEINRGNISKIFGELITLIEDSKREGAGEAMSVTLPYSGDSFSVPKNVYILGTMNTADRSIALMDTALRRRFEFEEMMPKPEILVDDQNKPLMIDDIDIQKLLKTINARIEFFYDREHTIGHAYFTKLMKPQNRNLQVLGDIFRNKVIPLLQEYFYDDYQKLYYILGDNNKPSDKFRFVIKEDVDVNALFEGQDLEDNRLFRRKKDETTFVLNKDVGDKDPYLQVESYIGICNK